MKTSFRWQLLLFTGVTLAVDFFPRNSAGTKCIRDSLSISCGPDPNVGGMCAYASDINQIWCCNVEEQNCWGYSQSCAGSSTDSPQLVCSRGGTNWCCNKLFEVCTPLTNQINVCIAAAFRNIVADGPLSAADASPSTNTSTSALPKVSDAPTVVNNASKNESEPISRPPAKSETLSAPTNSSSGISAGAAAGAAIGGLLGLAAIIMGVFFLGRKHGKKVKQNAGLEKASPLAPPEQVSPLEGAGDYHAPIKAEVDGVGIPRDKLATYELPS